MDYEALHIAHLSYKDRLKEREREAEKLRQRYRRAAGERKRLPFLLFAKRRNRRGEKCERDT